MASHYTCNILYPNYFLLTPGISIQWPQDYLLSAEISPKLTILSEKDLLSSDTEPGLNLKPYTPQNLQDMFSCLNWELLKVKNQLLIICNFGLRWRRIFYLEYPIRIGITSPQVVQWKFGKWVLFLFLFLFCVRQRVGESTYLQPGPRIQLPWFIETDF